jgi:hypothetical protein
MKHIKLNFKLLFFCLVLNQYQVKAWGFFAHQLINEKAVFCLPLDIFSFYKKNISYIKEHAVDPDKRRYIV